MFQILLEMDSDFSFGIVRNVESSQSGKGQTDEQWTKMNKISMKTSVQATCT